VVADEVIDDRALGILRKPVAMRRPLTAVGGTRPWAPPEERDDPGARPAG